MGHRDALIDAETLELMEHRCMGHIGRVAAEYLAGCKYADRNASPLHRTDLNGGGLRPERESVGRIERVLRFSGRVTLWNIQGVEIVMIGFDLAIVLDGIAHRDKYVLDLLSD